MSLKTIVNNILFFILLSITAVNMAMSENMKKTDNTYGIVFDCFGVVFQDRYKQFLLDNQMSLSEYIKNNSVPEELKKSSDTWNYPDYYNYLSQQIDLQLISDEIYYDIFSKASKIPSEEIKNIFRDTDCLNQKITQLIINLKNSGYKTALIANADRAFIDQFLLKKISYPRFTKVSDLFDIILTSSDLFSENLQVNKSDTEAIKIISKNLGVSKNNLIFIDDSQREINFYKKRGLHSILYKNSINSLKNELYMIMSLSPEYVVINDDSIDKHKRSILTTPAKNISFPLSKEDKQVIKILEKKYDNEENCAGLAAPQIGFNKRVIIFGLSAKLLDDPKIKASRKDFVQTMEKSIWINPSYSPIGEEQTKDYEGCFSVHTWVVPTPRYNKIQYNATLVDGTEITGIAEGFLARVIQHEIDHLNGKLCIDYSSKRDRITHEEYKKLREKLVSKIK